MMTFRASLLRNLVPMIILLGAAIIGATFLGTRKGLQQLAEQLTNQASERAALELDGFIDPVRRQLLQVDAWGQEGLLTSESRQQTLDLILPILTEYPQIFAVAFTDEDGNHGMILRKGDELLVRVVRPGRNELIGETFRLSTDLRVPEQTQMYAPADDPRENPVFRRVIDQWKKIDPTRGEDHANNVVWTEPHMLYGTDTPVITAAAAYRAPTDRFVVVEFAIRLEEFSVFTTSMNVGSTGKCMLASNDMILMGLPRDDRFASEGARYEILRDFKRPRDLNLPITEAASQALGARPDDADQVTPRVLNKPVRVQVEADPWWMEVRPYPLNQETNLWIGVALPERDLLHDYLPLRLLIVSVALIALIFATWRAFRVAGIYSDPLEKLEAESVRISHLQLDDPCHVKSNIKEINRLALAHERMRTGLQHMMRMERDIQLARQIQQSTFPSEMPKLDGFVMAAWSEPAEETGGDTYDLIGYTFDLAGYDDASAEEQVRLAGAGKADRAVVLLADATGHGIGPALAVTQIRSMLRMSVRMRQGPDKFIYHLNDQLCADLPEDRFITAWIGEINADAGTIRMFSAGQGPILLYRAASNEIEVRPADAPPLGVVPDMQFTISDPIQLKKGDIVAVISDGIYEAMNPADELFGTNRVADIIKQRAGKAPDTILKALRQAVNEFTHDAEPADDQTIVLIKKS